MNQRVTPSLLLLGIAFLAPPLAARGELTLDSLFRPAPEEPVEEIVEPQREPEPVAESEERVEETQPAAADPAAANAGSPSAQWQVTRVGVFTVPSPRMVARRDPAPAAEEEQSAAEQGNPLGMSELPTLPPRGFSQRDTELREDRPLWEDKGRVIGARSDMAKVRAANPTRDLLIRYVVEPANGNDSAAGELVFQLGPEQSDSFQIPPGEWAITREVWRNDTAPRRVTQRYPAMNLRPGHEYELPAGDTAVRRLNRELDLLVRTAASR